LGQELLDKRGKRETASYTDDVRGKWTIRRDAGRSGMRDAHIQQKGLGKGVTANER